MNNSPDNYDSIDPQYLADSNQVQKGSRNVWLLTCGIITAVFLFISLCTAFIFAIIAITFGAMKSSTPYQDAIYAVQTNTAAIEALGEPIEAGWFMSGSIETNNNSGNASFSIPVSGPKGKGTVYVEAQKFNGNWQYSQLLLEVEGQANPIPLSVSNE